MNDISTEFFYKYKTKIRKDQLKFDAHITAEKNIIIWGTQIYFKENIEKFKKRYKNIKYVYPDGSISNDIAKEYKVLNSIEEIKAIENSIVIIAKGKAEDVANIGKTLRSFSIMYDHMDFYVEEKLNIRYIKALEYYNYIDWRNNKFYISPQISDKITFRRMNCSNCCGIILNNHISRRLFITLMGDSSCIYIGENNTFIDVIINICTNGKVIIRNDNMFSHHITLNQSDMHHIFDLKTGNRINYPKDIVIGNHVWVGREVEFLGGANIGDNCVVGARTVTSSKFPNNVVLAGCPGKIIRENIIWARDDLKIYNHDNYKEAVDKLGEKYIHKELPE